MKPTVDFFRAFALVERLEALLYIGRIVTKNMEKIVRIGTIPTSLSKKSHGIKRVDKRIYKRMYMSSHNEYAKLWMEIAFFIEGKRPIYRKRNRVIRKKMNKAFWYMMRTHNRPDDEYAMLLKEYLLTYIPWEHRNTWPYDANGNVREMWGREKLQEMRDKT